MNNLSRWVAIVSVLLVGAGISIAARNSSGTYSLPSGNPVVSGSTISSSWANTTLSDIATGVTDSLDRYGRGAMQAPLKSTDGTETAPGLTFSLEQTSGLYRAGSGDVRLSVSGSDVAQWESTGETLTGDLAVSGDADVTGDITVAALTSSDGVTVTRSTANSAGITATGSGTGAGVVGVGGSGGGIGGDFLSSGSATAIRANSTGTGYAATIHSTGAIEGLYAKGGAGKAGGLFEPGTAATASTPQDAVKLVSGYLNLDGVTVPSSTTSIKNRLTPSNIIKAWGVIGCASSGCSITRGFNLTSVSATSGHLVVTLAADITSGAVVAGFDGSGGVTAVHASVDSSGVAIGFYDGSTAVDVSDLTSTVTVNFIATGVQ